MSEELHDAAHLDELVDQWKAEDDVRREICDIGSRIWQRAFSAGNEGNISYRLSEHFIVCTPTMVSKGFLQPKDLAVIDFDMHQIKGDRRYTSEIRLHMQIYKENPKVRAVVHCHPPHATAFGVAGEEIPLGVLPEPEIFLGAVPRAVYETPGTWDFAKTVLPHVKNANTVILANHGTVSWDTQSVERAFWYT
ncbi:MAG: class II aldolase/adducin family protein, partial [Planctomycetota bacterium]